MKKEQFYNSDYYNLIYDDLKYKTEVNYLLNIFNNHDSNKKSLLDLGCGTGRHAKLFNLNGFNVDGVDINENMLKNAYKFQNKNLKFFKKDITKFRIDKKYDFIISLFHVFSYLTKNYQLKNFFKTLNVHAKRDALVYFDFWYFKSVKFLKPDIRYKMFESKKLNFLRISKGRLNEKNKLTKIEIDYFHFLKNRNFQYFYENHLMRAFEINEITKLAKDYGFKKIKLSEIITNKAPSNKTWALGILLKKI